jgi:hypothetical protein
MAEKKPEELIPDHLQDVACEWGSRTQAQKEEHERTVKRLRAIFGPSNQWINEQEVIEALGMTRRELYGLVSVKYLEYDRQGNYRVKGELLD